MDLDTIQSPRANLAAFAAGVALHLCAYRYGEWDLATPKIIASYAMLLVGSVIGLRRLSIENANPLDVSEAIKIASLLFAAFVSGTWTSMLIYRGFFHRLCKFPGPFAARFSNVYATSLTAKKLHMYEEIQKLHEQYGDYVRLGPQQLSINNSEAMAAIHNVSSQCTKGPWYNILHPMVALNMIRNKPEHVRRRRVWDRGFSAKALRDYEPRVHAYTDQLLDHLKKTEGQPVNMTDWFSFYSFDVMGDLAWGKSFNMLKNGIKHYFMDSLHADMANVGYFTYTVWLFPVVKATPIINRTYKIFWTWVNNQVIERKQMKPDRPDVFSWLLEDHNSKQASAQDEINLTGDAYLIAVAGSDTTAAALTCLFFELAQKPGYVKQLQEEIKPIFDTDSINDSAAVGKLAFLNAAITEAMRMHPPVAGGVQRLTPPEGITVGDIFIPGDTMVQNPTYTMCRDARYFEKPNDYIPERWTTRPELNVDASVYAPFGFGRYSCIGKNLGLIEIRNVVANILHRYDVKFAPEQTTEAFLSGKKDTFTLACDPLSLVFTPRASNA